MAIFENMTGGTWSPWPWPSPDPGYLSPYLVDAPSDPRTIWRTQPSVRKVVSYVARETAQLPWHAYERRGDSDRVRVRDSAVERLFREPSRFQTGYRLLRDLVTDLLLYDRCLAVGDIDSGQLLRIPARHWRVKGSGELGGVKILYRPSGEYDEVDITDAPMMVTWGWADTGLGGISPMQTIAEILEESRRSVEWRRRQWEDGVKFQGLLKHPGTFRNQAARDAFTLSWRKWRDESSGTPILEDGMSYEVPSTPTPKDTLDLEGRKLTDEEVASIFHVPPELVGSRAGNYSNMQAFRSMLYGPVLGPLIVDLQQAANALVQQLTDDPSIYVELSRETAMNGSLVEQAGILQTMTGGPIMLRSEARARLNLPYVDGTDELIVPLNVLEGGQASPTDSGSQNLRLALVRKSGVVAKAERKEVRERREALERELESLLRSQEEALGKAGIDVEEFLREWTPETAKRLLPHMQAAARSAAARVIDQIGATGWDESVMDAYLEEMAESAAEKVTSGTAEAVASGDDREQTFETLRASAVTWAGLLVTNAAGFGATDAARSSGAVRKTWRVRSQDPRPSHVRMNGETVDLDERFSNGARWPGDDSLPAEEAAGCRCEVEFEWEREL